MDDVYIYFIPLPSNIHEAVTPCIDGYTIYLNVNDDEYKQEESLKHAIEHISNNDFDKLNVQQIETNAHL